jgi:3D (Asp-Asp-Asp) domain-containing protein
MQHEIRNRALTALNRSILKIRRIKISAAFILFGAVDLLSAALGFLVARLSSPKGRFFTVIVAVAVMVPSLLFLRERSERIQKEYAFRYMETTVFPENIALKNTVRDLYKERLQLRNLLLDAGYRLKTPDELHIKLVATGYSSCPSETDSTPFTTAANTNTRPGVIALSRDLLQPYTPDAPFSFGDRVYLDNLGEFVVEDSMNRRWKNRADIWFPSKREALLFGKREIYLSKFNDEREILGMVGKSETN